MSLRQAVLAIVISALLSPTLADNTIDFSPPELEQLGHLADLRKNSGISSSSLDFGHNDWMASPGHHPHRGKQDKRSFLSDHSFFMRKNKRHNGSSHKRPHPDGDVIVLLDKKVVDLPPSRRPSKKSAPSPLSNSSPDSSSSSSSSSSSVKKLRSIAKFD